MSSNLRGALMMVASMAAFVLNDTAIKLTQGALPLFQLIFLRGVLSSVLIFALGRSLGVLRFDISARDMMLIVARGGAEVVTAYLFLTALFNMPLGNVTAILQAVPLTVTLGSALVFREAIGWRRMLAILIGFFGVLLIVQPGAGGFNQWSLYALAAVLGVTVRDLITRSVSQDVPGMTITLGTSVAVMCAAGLATLGHDWVPVDGRTSMLLGASGVLIVGGYYFSVQVMRTGDIAFVAPFRYSGLILAMLIGLIAFNEAPSPLTLLGAAIVTGTGIFTFYRERQLSKRKVVPHSHG